MTQTRKLAGKEAEIVEATIRGDSTRDIARQVGTHHSTVARERVRLREMVQQAETDGTLRTLDGILRLLGGLMDAASEAVDQARDEGDLKLALAAIKEARDTITRYGDFAGLSPKQSNSVTVNVGVSTLVHTHNVTEAEVQQILEIRRWPEMPATERLRLLQEQVDATRAEIGDGEGKGG